MNLKFRSPSLVPELAKSLGYDIEVSTQREMVDVTMMGGKKEFLIMEMPCTIRVLDTLTEREYRWTAATPDLAESVDECLRALVAGDLG